MPRQRSPLRDLHAVKVRLSEIEQDAHRDAESGHKGHEQLRGPQLLRYHTFMRRRWRRALREGEKEEGKTYIYGENRWAGKGGWLKETLYRVLRCDLSHFSIFYSEYILFSRKKIIFVGSE